MIKSILSGWVLSVGCSLIFVQAIAAQELKQRTFEFTYSGVINDIAEGSKVRLWLPIAQTTDEQEVELVEKNLPGRSLETAESKYGNKMYYCELTGNGTPISFSLKYRVQRKEVRGFNDPTQGELSQHDRELFLSDNELVPVGGRSIELFEQFNQNNESARKTDSSDTVATSMKIYDFVYDHVAYDKSKPGYGNGDVRWVCDSKTGNCTDFHSLFISVARERKIPAKFEIGFPLPPERGAGKIGGYHCWAKFFDKEKGWLPVDISEADKHPELAKYYFGNLTENRIQLTTGRDLVLEPKQEAGPLNYFVYPHVEVDGKEVERSAVELEFHYRDKE